MEEREHAEPGQSQNCAQSGFFLGVATITGCSCTHLCSAVVDEVEGDRSVSLTARRGGAVIILSDFHLPIFDATPRTNH